MGSKSKSKGKGNSGFDIDIITNSKSESDELINKLINSLNKLISKDIISVETTRLSNELIETLKIMENCTSCKKYDIKEKYFDNLHKLINKTVNYKINNELIKKDNELNTKVLCEDCKEKKIEYLITKCGNEELARLLYDSKFNLNYSSDCIQWIPFNEFINIKYLAKGGFGEVQKAEWIGHYDDDGNEWKVVLKRLYNSRDKILDILKEVN